VSISRRWSLAVAACALAFAGTAQAAPVLYSFVSGSAVVRLTIGTTTLASSAPLVLGGVSATFDAEANAFQGALTDFDFQIVPEQTVTLDFALNGFDEILLHTAILTPGSGYTTVYSSNNGGGNYDIAGAPVHTSTNLVVMSSTGTPSPVPYMYMGDSPDPLVGTIQLTGATHLNLQGVTIGSFTSAEFPATIPPGVTIVVKLDLDFNGETPVPEPSALALIGLGFAGLAGLRARGT